MPILLKRAYDDPSPEDGHRVLVDRLWPRGVSRDRLRLDAWMQEISPSDELRRWTHADPSRWDEFRRRYRAELESHRDELLALAERAAGGTVTLVFAAKDEERNNAVVLKEYLEELTGSGV